jgi:uncharacterized protein (DUF1697 family)
MADGMTTYLALIRGINVGGKNPVSMGQLKQCLEEHGYEKVTTYIASGNVILQSEKPAIEIQDQIEKILPENFKLDDGFVKVLTLSYQQLRSVVENKPVGFGEQPDLYHSDGIFLIGVDSSEVMPVFNPREGVDQIWPGEGVIYSQRLSSQRTKSRLNKMMSSPYYKSMTIRNWNTVTTLFEIMKKING